MRALSSTYGNILRNMRSGQQKKIIRKEIDKGEKEDKPVKPGK